MKFYFRKASNFIVKLFHDKPDGINDAVDHYMEMDMGLDEMRYEGKFIDIPLIIKYDRSHSTWGNWTLFYTRVFCYITDERRGQWIVQKCGELEMTGMEKL